MLRANMGMVVLLVGIVWNGVMELSEGTESRGTEWWNFLTLNNRTHGKADPFLRQTQDRRVAQDDKKRKREG